MPTRFNRSSRYLSTGSLLAWLSLALALLQPYGRPVDRWVQSDSGAWYQLSQLVGGLCLPSGTRSSDGQGPASAIEPFCGLCVTGGSLTAALPDRLVVATTAESGDRYGSPPVVRAVDHRTADRPPVRGPPASRRLS